mmetsp:Transcript_17889/g.37755  ORF Transcript_17889/g.37755 Transcript_17889/m.37755 type:complete len:84 (-) Transcript_17889:36-287(-)
MNLACPCYDSMCQKDIINTQSMHHVALPAALSISGNEDSAGESAGSAIRALLDPRLGSQLPRWMGAGCDLERFAPLGRSDCQP